MRQSSLASGQPGRGGGREAGRPARPPGRSRSSLALASGAPAASRQVLAGSNSRLAGRGALASLPAMLPCPCTPGLWPPGTEPRPGPTPPAPFRLSGRRQLRAHAPYAPSARLRARTRYVPRTARLRARRTAAIRRGCPFRFPRLRRADRGSRRGQGCLSLRSLSRGYGFAYTGGGCRPPGPPPGHAPQLARLDEGETPLNSPPCGRAPLRGRRRCAPHAPSAPPCRIRAPSPRRARHYTGNAPRGRPAGPGNIA